MKNIVTILTSAIITSLIWLMVLQDDRYNRLRALEQDVWMPMRSILRDLKSTGMDGDNELLMLKLDLLGKKWDDYIFNGEVPYEFSEKIISADKDFIKSSVEDKGKEVK